VKRQERRVGRPDGELTAVGLCETEADPAHPGDVEVAIRTVTDSFIHSRPGGCPLVWAHKERPRPTEVPRPARRPSMRPKPRSSVCEHPASEGNTAPHERTIRAPPLGTQPGA
jgi:hypothetical protein